MVDAGSGAESGPPVTRVAVPVDTRAPTGTTNAYLVDGLLVDPAARTDRLETAIADHEGGGGLNRDAGVDAIAVTHAHPDHVGAVAEYAAATGATVYAHADHADRFREATGIAPDATLSDGDRVGNADVRALETPGHAPDHLAFAVGGGDESEASGPRDLLVGDLAVAEGSVVVGAPEGDLRAYVASLERVRDAGAERLHPGHGPTVADPAATCQRLIDHRLRREQRVLSAVETGASDVDAVLERAYDKDLTGVEDLARATVVAHLKKLAAEGRVDGSWAPSRSE